MQIEIMVYICTGVLLRYNRVQQVLFQDKNHKLNIIPLVILITTKSILYVALFRKMYLIFYISLRTYYL